MSKQRIIDYVMNTPGNTNPNVLNSLLDEEMNDLPPIGPEDKNKYLHTNESTGALEWAEGSSGGGVLVVHQSGDTQTGYTLDKTWQEIYDADYSVIVSAGTDSKDYLPIRSVYIEEQVYYVDTSISDTYGTNSADGYPKSGGGK